MKEKNYTSRMELTLEHVGGQQGKMGVVFDKMTADDGVNMLACAILNMAHDMNIPSHKLMAALTVCVMQHDILGDVKSPDHHVSIDTSAIQEAVERMKGENYGSEET